MAYIDKDKVLEICEKHYQHCLEMHDYCGDTTADNIKEDIEKLPTADVMEVKHGYWTDNGRCSYCEAFSVSHGADYCPKCGAKMDGKPQKEVRGMAEYIEREALLTVIREIFDRTDPNGEEQMGVLKCHRIVREAPAADVVPKSEVAREIFEEIEKWRSQSGYVFVFTSEAFDELKKKYTEGL